MTLLAKHRVLFTAIVVLLITAAAIVAIFWARGFKPDFARGRIGIERTGLLVASSIPTGAQVYLDNRLTSATDTNIAFLEPGTYRMRIQKDGYTTWEKDVEIKADLATEIKALLFPTAPQISPLTATGSFNPSLSPDGSKIVFGVPGERSGVYLLTMADRPFAFRQGPKLLAKNTPLFDFSKSQFIWSPDSNQVIASFAAGENQQGANLLIDIDKTDQELTDITASLRATLNTWQEQLRTIAQTQATAVPDSVKTATTEATPILNSQFSTLNSQLNYYPAGLIFSPDEEKVLYRVREDQLKVYDLKLKKEYILPNFSDLLNISWYPDSAHLVVAQKDLIAIIEIDGSNKMTIYAGSFENGFVFAHPSGTRLIILTRLTQSEGTPANLYSINLR